MAQKQIPVDLENIVNGTRGDAVYENSLAELTDWLMPMQSATARELTDRLLLKDIIEYTIHSHGTQTRQTGGLYARHPLEVSYAVAQNVTDFPSIAAALLHDHPEERAEEQLNEYLKNQLSLIFRIPIIVSPYVWYKRHRTDRNAFFEHELNSLYEELNHIVDRRVRDSYKREYYRKVHSVYSIDQVLTRRGEGTYYDDIRNIFKSELSYENKVRAILVKLKDRDNNAQTMNPSRSFSQHVHARTSTTRWQDLAFLHAAGKKWNVRYRQLRNRFEHIFEDFGPYNMDYRIRTSAKNLVMLNQTRDFNLDIQMITDEAAPLQELFKNYLERHREFPFKDSKMLFTRGGLSDLVMDLRTDRDLIDDIDRLKRHLSNNAIYFSDQSRVWEEIGTLSHAHSFKNHIDDVRFYLMVEHTHKVLSKYHFGRDEKISSIQQILKFWDSYHIDDSLRQTAKSTLASLSNCINHMRTYHVGPKRFFKRKQIVDSYPHIDQLTQPTGSRLDGYFRRRMDPKIRKTTGATVASYLDLFHHSNYLTDALLMRKLILEYIRNPDHVVRGIAPTGIVDYGWGYVA
jgi:hypothetical protein